MRQNDDNIKIKPLFVFNSFLVLVVLTASLITVLSGCSKETDDDDDLVGNWALRSSLEGNARTEAVTFTIGNKAYVGGGYDGDNRLTDFYEFDGTGTWKPIAPFPGTPRNAAVAFSINGKGYVGTGYDENDNKLKDFWEYDPVTDVWTRKADFGGTARYNAIGFAIGSKGYISTGYDGQYLKDMWEYTPGATAADSGTWTQKTSMQSNSKRTEASVFVHNNLAYIVGGFWNNTYPNDLWVYNPADDSWSQKRKISSTNDDEDYDDDYEDNIRRSNAVVFVIGNKAYLSCGRQNSVTATTWAYDIANDLWEEKTGLEGSAREGALAFTINGKGYIVTGSNSSYYFDDLWEFFPDAEQDDNDNN